MSNGGWFAYGSNVSGSLDQDVDAFFRGQPRPNEIPICIAGGVALSATETRAVWLSGAAIHSSGVSLSIHCALREAATTTGVAYYRWSAFFGVEFSDGTCLSSNTWNDGPHGIRSQGSQSSETTCSFRYFLYPIPPDGITRFHFLHPGFEVPECSGEIDTTGWRDIGTQVKPLWPLQVPQESETLPTEPPLASDSWFRKFLNETP